MWDRGKGSVELGRLPKVTMEFHEAEVKVVLSLIARNTRINLVMSDNLGRSCGMNVKIVSWRDVIYAMSREHPFHIEAQAPGVFIIDALLRRRVLGRLATVGTP